ncbi:thioredoxin 1 [Sedimentibacter acidaminivorans]|jgi:thioredoxin|uniref:Thioredoxin n=1 Tax=Sedimentibacter acidaminivorans TaxID=913099 RepID=A0ABS4GF44_9FIRM|nr:thioredoxin [Sedimentibacter acidaminivorans]MBP1926320.1 thioredoxin 1 [Sedimentibacter acidaminivorans]
MNILYPKNTKEFDDIIKKDKLVLVDFWATWCSPCRMLAPVIEKIAEQYEGKITVLKVDVDDQQELAIRYGIQSIPTVTLFKDGNVAAKEIGVKPLNSFTSMIEANIA